jgi:hypothetical protein
MFDGATNPPGGPHAEIVALTAAGERAAGGALTVTLEPCAHHGRTPPCTEAIIAAGVRRVIVAVEDPDAQVAGRGIAALRTAGVEVSVRRVFALPFSCSMSGLSGRQSVGTAASSPVGPASARSGRRETDQPSITTPCGLRPSRGPAALLDRRPQP